MAAQRRLRNVAAVHTVTQWVRAVRTQPCGDAVIALTVFGLIVGVQVVKPDEWRGQLLHQHMTMAAGVVLAAGCATLVFRRRWPRTVLAATVACALGYFVVGPSHGPAT